MVMLSGAASATGDKAIDKAKAIAMPTGLNIWSPHVMTGEGHDIECMLKNSIPRESQGINSRS